MMRIAAMRVIAYAVLLVFFSASFTVYAKGPIEARKELDQLHIPFSRDAFINKGKR